MAEKLIMRLIVDEQERQRLEANLHPKSPTNITRTIEVTTIRGEYLSPESISDVESAYRTFEFIREHEYNNNGQKTTIEITYI